MTKTGAARTALTTLGLLGWLWSADWRWAVTGAALTVPLTAWDAACRSERRYTATRARAWSIPADPTPRGPNLPGYGEPLPPPGVRHLRPVDPA